MNILNRKTGLNKTIILNIFSTVFLQGIAFISMPIFTRMLSSKQFGFYSIYNTWVSILCTVLPFGLSTCVSSGMYYFKDEYFDFRNSLIVFNSILTLLICIICKVLYKPLSYIFEYNFSIFVILFLTAFPQNIVSLITGFLIYEKKQY